MSAGMLVGSVCVWTEGCRSMQVLGFVSEIVTRAIVNQGLFQHLLARSMESHDAPSWSHPPSGRSFPRFKPRYDPSDYPRRPQTYLISGNFAPPFCTVRTRRRRPYIDCGILFRLICRPLQRLFRPGREAYLGRRRPSAPPPSPHRPPGCASASQWS